MLYLFTIPYVSPARTMFHYFTFSDSAASPQPYLIILRLYYSDLVLVSRSGASASLVYILRVLVTVDLRTNITYFSLVSV